MSKVTTKLQVTLPKVLADRYRIRPGDEIEWRAAGEIIHVIPRTGAAAPAAHASLDTAARLRLFDRATERQRKREGRRGRPKRRPGGRGWKREDLYDRGRPR